MERSLPTTVFWSAFTPILLVLSLWIWPWLEIGPMPGVRVGGTPLPKSGSVEAFLTQRAELWSGESLAIEAGYHVWQPTRAELGYELSVEEALTAIFQVGKSASPVVALRAWWRGSFGQGHNVRWRGKLANEALLDEYAERLRAEVDRLPIPGSYDPEGKPIDGLPGEALDVEAVKSAIRGALAGNASNLRVTTVVTPPPRSHRRFANPLSDATVLMVRQETTYRPGSGGRATNIELAARKLDGLLVMPGASLSFNTVVGKREASRGFAPALELMNGEVVQGIGGGVCQVAGTLHAAAFFAGLLVEEYHPHSRLNQFAYLRPGLDTMVAWPDHVRDVSGTKDMRIRNPYPFPVVIKTKLVQVGPGQASLQVEMYGASKPFRVDFNFREISRVPAGELRRLDETLLSGEQRVHQQPLDGIVIMRSRTIYIPTGRVDEETRVAYPPTPKIVLYGA